MSTETRVRGATRWPPPDILQLGGGTRLVHRGDWMALGYNAGGKRNNAKVFDGPYGLRVLVSLDDRGDELGALLHASLSLPRGYPSWDLIYAVARAVFGAEVDCMLPIPREAAFIHGVTPAQRRGTVRQVFHVTEMPQSWPKEGA